MDNTIIFSDKNTYASFPCLAVDKNIIYCVFRLNSGATDETHIDTRSTIQIYQSNDNGNNWQQVSSISRDDDTGLQDPAIAIIDNELFINCYGWQAYKKEHTTKREQVKMVGPLIYVSKRNNFKWSNFANRISIPIANRTRLARIDPSNWLVGHADHSAR